MNDDRVPYIITYVSYNYICNDRGTIEETMLETFLLDEVSEYIINNSFSMKFDDVNDVINFWKKYKGYNVWDAHCVKNGDWINVKPSNESILSNIRKMIVMTSNTSNEAEENVEIQNKMLIVDANEIVIDWNMISNVEQECQLNQFSLNN